VAGHDRNQILGTTYANRAGEPPVAAPKRPANHGKVRAKTVKTRIFAGKSATIQGKSFSLVLLNINLSFYDLTTSPLFFMVIAFSSWSGQERPKVTPLASVVSLGKLSGARARHTESKGGLTQCGYGAAHTARKL